MNQHSALQVISIIGVMIFTSIIAISFFFSKQLEETALDFIKSEITTELHERVSSLTGINSETLTLRKKYS